MVTTIFSFVGMVFFATMFCLGFVLSWFNSSNVNSDFGRNLSVCLIGAVLCAYLGGW